MEPHNYIMDLRVLRLLFVYQIVVLYAFAEGQIITATIGQDVTLPCQAMNYRPFEVVEWSRPGKHSEYVLIFKNQNPDLKIPERYEGRVELKDRENGDVSLKLRNITAKDEGTYECYVLKETNRRKRYIEPLNTVYLQVSPGRGYIGLVAVAVVVALAVLTVLTVLTAVFVLKKRGSFHSLSPHDEAENPQNVDMSRTFHLSSPFSHDSNPAIRKSTTTFHPDAGPQPGKMERVV